MWASERSPKRKFDFKIAPTQTIDEVFIYLNFILIFFKGFQICKKSSQAKQNLKRNKGLSIPNESKHNQSLTYLNLTVSHIFLESFYDLKKKTAQFWIEFRFKFVLK